MEKIKSNMLGYGIAAFVVVMIVIIAIIINRSEIPYTISADQALQEMADKANYIEPTSLAELNGAVFIDVRNPQEYDLNHYKGAINIPAERIFLEENVEAVRELNSQGKPIVLYGAVPGQTAGLWLLMKQTGINNVKMFNGTFEQLTSGKAEALTIYNEVPVIDTTALLKNQKVEKKPAEVKPVAKKVAPVRTEPQVESGGGC